jgi:hypothetical protein
MGSFGNGSLGFAAHFSRVFRRGVVARAVMPTFASDTVSQSGRSVETNLDTAGTNTRATAARGREKCALTAATLALADQAHQQA